MIKYLVTTIMIFALYTQLLYAQWTYITLPAGRGGAVHSICIKGTKLFAGKHEGIYVSEDNSLHWRKINPYLPPRYSNPYLFSIAATDEYIVVAGSDMGVHISTDDGETWINQGFETALRRTPYVIAANGKWIICGYPITGYPNSWQSTDKGQSWSKFPSNIEYVYSAAIQDSIAIIGTSTGLFRSDDYGFTWNNVYEIQPTYFEALPIAFSKNMAYAGISNLTGKGYILSSPDSGLSWPDRYDLSVHFINSIVGSPAEADSNFIFAATDSGVFRWSDNDQSWIKKNNGINSDLIFSLAFKVQGTEGSPKLFAGTGNGIFCSSDNANNWTEVGSPSEWLFTASGTDIFALSSHTSYYGNSKYVYSASISNYNAVVCHSNDNGSSWDQVYSGFLDHNPRITSFTVNDNDILFTAGSWNPEILYKNSIVLTSANGGLNWETIYIDESTSSPLLGPCLSDVYMKTYGQYDGSISRFSDNGKIWEKLNPKLTPLAHMDTITNPSVSDFAADGNKIYLAGGDIGFISGRPLTTFVYNIIAFSTDYGQNWTRIESSLDSETVIKDQTTDTLSIITKIYPDGEHIMVGMRSWNFFEHPYSVPISNGGNFYHLYYNGEKWIIADTAFTNTSVFGFVANGYTIFAATEDGVFSTNDYGSNWNEINTGMGNICTTDLFRTDSYLFASTHNGLWKRPLSEIASVDRKNINDYLPQKFSLSQNYPNPFNPTTSIYYQLKTKSHVQLTIYDITGQEVKKLINQNQNAGQYSVNFNATNLASGIYVYRLKTDSFEQSRKMILLR